MLETNKKIFINIERNKFEKKVLKHQKSHDEEICAVLFGTKSNDKQLFTVYKLEFVENIEYEKKSFLMDPKVVYNIISKHERENNWEIVAIFHTHPNNLIIKPSSKDIKFMSYWQDTIWLIANFQDKKNNLVIKGFYLLNKELKQAQITFIIQ